MTQIIPAGFGEVIHQLRLQNDAEPMAITYGVQFDAQAPADAQATAQGLHNAFANTLFSIPHSSYTLYQTELRFVIAELAGVQIAVHISPIIAQGTANPLPQNCALLFHKRSASAGRRNRGRFYLPGASEGAVDPAGRLAGGELGAFNTLATSFLTAVKAVGSIAELVVLHAPGVTAAPAPSVVTFMNVDPVIATQRRRLRK